MRKSEKLSDKLEQVTLVFPNKQLRAGFIDWFCNSGEQAFFQDAEEQGLPGFRILYNRVYPSWGYNSNKHGEPVIEIEVDDEDSR